MTNYIAPELTDRSSRDVYKKEIVDFIRGYSDKELIKSALSFNSSDFGYKVREFLLPAFRAQEREIARNILSEKGIDYKVKERECQIQKEKTKQKMKKLGDFIKNINLFNIL